MSQNQQSGDTQVALEASEDMIGHYQTVEDLGVGGYSRVKLAVDTRSKQKVAVKILLSEPKKETDPNNPNQDVVNWVISDSKVKQCKREIKLMQSIQHKNVVALVDFIEDATFPQKDKNNRIVKTPCLCVVLEYCSRGELFDFLMYTGRLGERATRTYFQQFLNGLNAMHKSGYAHRDLKPENLLLGDDFTLKIADFGFATQFKDQRKKIKMATTCGTKGYLAPELLAGHKYTHKVDLFAVGIIMFTTFAGFPPFQHAGAGDWWWDKMAKAWTYWTEAPLAKNEIETNERYKKGNEKMRLFWAAHERSLPFEDTFKELMQYLLNPYPKQRYDIEDVLKHPWMKGKTFSRRQLVKYMKQYSSTVRAQRAIKIKKQVDEMIGNNNNNHAKRAIISSIGQKNLEDFEKKTKEFEEALDKTEENEELVRKTNFKFESTKPLLEILKTLDTVARLHDAKIDMEVSKCQLKILAGLTRTSNMKKNKAPLESEDIGIMVKVYKSSVPTFDQLPSNFEFDIEGKFLDEDDDDEKDEKDENDASSQAQVQAKSNDEKKEKRWVVLFYRIEGSADGFQQLMSRMFYHPSLNCVMNNDAILKAVADAKATKQIDSMPVTARAFIDVFKAPPKEDALKQNVVANGNAYEIE